MKTSETGINHESALVWKRTPFSGPIEQWAAMFSGCTVYAYSNGHWHNLTTDTGGKVDTLEEAKQAAEDALRKHLESERDRFDKLLRELNGDVEK